MSNAVVEEKADEEDRDLDGVVTAFEADGSGLREKFRALQTEYRTKLTEIPAGLVDVMQIAKRSITLGEQLRKSDRLLQKS